jgi:GR25 family glycosyltransferase involved in LPS biosynthesis
MKLTDFFEKTYCVNLDRRPDRWSESLDEFNKFNLTSIERVSAVDGKITQIQLKNRNTNTSEMALVMTNINIIQNAKKEGLKSILILEDDVEFTDEVNNISEYFKFLPEDWDMVYFGGNHNTHMRIQPPKIINEKVCKLHQTYSTHCVGIKETAYDIILDNLKDLMKQLDVVYSDLQKRLNVYSFYPMIATQRVGFSDIQDKTVDYKWLIK